MTIDQWVNLTNTSFVEQKHQRLGQFYMNNLYLSRRDLYGKVIDTENDCFYDDLKIENFLRYLYSNW